MWLLSWIREGKQQKLLIQDQHDVLNWFTSNKDIGMLVEWIPVYTKKSESPKKESTSTRLIPLSDTIQKD